MMDDRTNAQQDLSLIPQPSSMSSRPFRPYSEYRDSGVEWLGEIPAQWAVTTLKRVGDLQAGVGFPEEEQGKESGNIPFFKVSNLGTEGNEIEIVHCPNIVSHETAPRLRAFVFPS
jgi:type I restriction enzyme S subunit